MGYGGQLFGLSVSGTPDTDGLLKGVLRPGLLSQRPQAGHVYTGKFYHATDYQNGTLYLCNGIAWLQVASGIDGAGFVSDSVGHPMSLGSSPSAAANTGSFPGATAVITQGTDVNHVLQVSTSLTTVGSQVLCTVTFAKVWDDTPYGVTLEPCNSAAALLSGTTQVYVATANVASNQYQVSAGTAAVAALTVYQWICSVKS